MPTTESPPARTTRSALVRLVVSAALLAALVWLLWPAPASAPEAIGRQRPDAAGNVRVDDTTAAAASLQRASHPDAPAAQASSPPELPALPDANVPFDRQFDALLARARAGDGHAACRLALDAMRCDAARRQRAFADLMERSMAGDTPGGDDRHIDVIAGSRERADATGNGCGRADADALPSPDSYLPDIAAALPVRARVILAMTSEDGGLRRLPRVLPTRTHRVNGRSTDYVVPQFLADNDMRFLDAGIAAGDPLALEGMMLVHAPSVLPSGYGPAPLRQSRPDPTRYAFHAMVLQRLHGDAALGHFPLDLLTRVLALQSETQRAALEQRVDAEVQRWQRLPATVPATLPDADTPAFDKCRP